MKILVTCWIWSSDLKVVTTAKLQWHPSNIKVIQRTKQVYFGKKKPATNGAKWIGLKRYIQNTIWYKTWYGAHDTICSPIHLPFLAGKQRLVIPACDQKHHTPPTTTACAVIMSNGYNNGGLLRVSRCSVFVMNLLMLLEYTGCYLWYLMFVSILGMCYNCTVSHRIFLRAYGNMYCSLCIGSIPVYRFSPKNELMEIW